MRTNVLYLLIIIYVKSQLFLIIPTAFDQFAVTVHALRKQQLILLMLRIPNRKNPLPPLYCTDFSVQKIPTRAQ